MAKKSFDHITNSWLYRASKVVGDAVIISALFLLFCLPVVTIGASVSALYYTVYRKYYKKYDNISKDFIRAFKENLKNGIIVHLVYLIYSAIVGFNIYVAFNGWGNIRLPDWYILVSFLPLLPIIFTLPFVYALMARFKNTIRGTVKNSFTLCMMNFPKFILIWIIVILAIAISVGFPPAALVIPAIATYLCQFITEKAFSRAMDVESARENNDEAKNASSEENDSEENSDEDDPEEEISDEENDMENTDD